MGFVAAPRGINRRFRVYRYAPDGDERIEVGELMIDCVSREVRINDRAMHVFPPARKAF